MFKSFLILVVALNVAAPPVEASSTVQYKNQKAGQFCKNLDIGKYVETPSSGRLKCVTKPGSARAKWVRS